MKGNANIVEILKNLTGIYDIRISKEEDVVAYLMNVFEVMLSDIKERQSR